MALRYPFEPLGPAEWAALAPERGVRPRTSREGLSQLPLYTELPSSQAGAPALPARRSWRILQELRAPTPELGAARAAQALRDGAEGLLLRAAGDGLRLSSAADWSTLRREAPRAALHLRPGARAREVGALLLAHGEALGELEGSLGLDPLGTLAQAGRLPQGLEAAYAQGTELALAFAEAPGCRVLDVEGAPYHDAGADAASELACVLAALVAGFRGMEPALDRLRPAITLSVGPDLLGNVAKLRAARALYAQLAEPCGLDPLDLWITCVSARRALSRRDPWGNLLRGTLTAWIGAVGGADAVCVAAYDRRYPDSDDLARRIACTTQLVLREEAHLAQVRDPLAGAWTVEALTEQLVERAWAAFQGLERDGGLARALTSGALQAQLREQAERREAGVRTRRLELTGVSAFPLAGERPLERSAPAARATPAPTAPESWAALLAQAEAGAALGDPPGAALEVAPCVARPLPAPFEALWERAGASPPTVFLASFGALAEHTARSTWVQNLLAAGGFVAEVPDGYADAAEAAQACRALGAALAVVCAPDPRWPELLAQGLPQALRSVGCARVVWAGVPAEREAEFRAAGVDGFVGLKRDALADLNLLWEGLA
ncbi:MAG: hypothetical protein KDD82_01810 [Planctomycetes bacterium]|nr:hypothetical protein [Planctomycetota bacterium]